MKRYNPKYLIAKYARDVQRMEPKNIGVILWTDFGVYCRFLPSSDVRRMVADVEVYQRWIDYWTHLCSSEEIAVHGRRPIAQSSPKFLRELSQTQKAKYILADGGIVVDSVSKRSATSVMDQLFEELVSRREAAAPEKNLASIAEEVLDRAGIIEMDGYKAGVNVPCPVFDTEQDLRFDYGVMTDNAPQSLFLRVAVGNQVSVTSGAFKMECVTKKQPIVDPSRCAAMVYATSVSRKQSAKLKMLEGFGTVVNLADQSDAIRKVRQIARAA
jgi:hypothetical protein